MKPKYKLNNLVVYENIVWWIVAIWTDPPIKYTLERVYPQGEQRKFIEESLLKLWDGRG